MRLLVAAFLALVFGAICCQEPKPTTTTQKRTAAFPLPDEPAVPVAAPTTIIRDVVTTAYCGCSVCCGSWSKFQKTSTGKPANTRGIAVATKLIPYGTKLRIPGYGVAVADDTGGAMRKDAAKGIYHIDLRFNSHQDALKWGRKKLTIEIVP